MKTISLFSFFFLSLQLTAFSQLNENEYLERKGEVYFTFQSVDRETLNDLSKIVSIDAVTPDAVFAYANEKELTLFKETGLPYSLLPHPGDGNEPMSSSIEEITDWNVYPTYDAYIAMMNQYASQYPNICRIVNAGSSQQGRSILFAVISDNVQQREAEPQFMFTSSIHGDETTGYILTLRLIDSLLTTYGSDPRITNLVNNVEIWINPLANPDGTYHGGNHTVNNARRYNANSVDINRNFPDPEDGPHPDGNAWQPETLVMTNIAGANNFRLSANYHGGAEVMNYPWDTWPRLHADDDWFQFVSHLYADTAQSHSTGTNYLRGFNDGITNGYAWYTISGGRQDYMNYFYHCREITMEISNTKLLSASLLPRYWYYNNKSMVDYIENVLYGVTGIVTDFSGNPLQARVEIGGHDLDSSHIYCDSLTGHYVRMLAPGSYDITFSAPGFQTRTISGVQVAQLTAHQLDVQLLPDNAQLLNPIAVSLPFLGESDASFIDYNIDGALDVCLIGGIANSMSTKLYINDGGDSFTETATPFPNVWRGTMLWADFDNDTYPDLFISGRSSSGLVSQMFFNNSGESFTPASTIFSELEYTAAASADINRDGLTDFVFTGSNNNGDPVSYIALNQGGTVFTLDSLTITPVTKGSLDFADYDRDGCPDLLVTGLSAAGPVSLLYRNNNGTLEQTAASFTGLYDGGAGFVDYNSDGSFDIVISGANSESALQSPLLYENNGDGTFTAVDLSLIAFTGAADFDFADFDNDGYSDFLFLGKNESGAGSTYLLKNNGDGSFIEYPVGITGFHSGAADWGDYNNDGSVDLIISGYGSTANILKSNNMAANTPPDSPTPQNTAQSDSIVTLSWNAANDDHTPQQGITYSVIVGSQPGLADIVTTESDIATGTRFVSRNGNAGSSTNLDIAGLHEATYYWQVQAIDGAFLGSPFSAVDSFTVTFIPDTITRPSDLTAEAQSSDFALLQWTDNAQNENGYYIERRDSGTTQFSIIDSSEMNTAAYTDSTILPDYAYEYRVTAFNADTVSVPSNIVPIHIPPVVSVNDAAIPKEYQLYQNYPNPFNPVTIIRFDIPETADVRLSVHTITGELIGTLIQNRYSPGSYSVTFDAYDLPSGVYLYRLQAGSFSDVRKLLLIK